MAIVFYLVNVLKILNSRPECGCINAYGGKNLIGLPTRMMTLPLMLCKSLIQLHSARKRFSPTQGFTKVWAIVRCKSPIWFGLDFALRFTVYSAFMLSPPLPRMHPFLQLSVWFTPVPMVHTDASALTLPLDPGSNSSIQVTLK